MGFIRTLLALSIVVFHSYAIFGERMCGGTVAVQLFYMISGFYMALILNEKYKKQKGSYKLFITNRFLKIYPAYWVCLFLVVLLCVAGKLFWNQPFYLWYWSSNWDALHWSAIVFFILANIFLLGSDWLFFSGMNSTTGKLELTHTPFNYNTMSFQFLLIPQIWSVGVEITFYLLAPFILRKNWLLQLGILLASLVLRYYLIYVKFWYFDPWTYRFFPTELAFFMAGSLAYQIFNYLKNKTISKTLTVFLWSIVVAGIIFYPHLNSIFTSKIFHLDYFSSESKFRWLFYFIFWICLPFIFLLTRSNKKDRVIGELSYPIYICHHFIMFLWRKYFFTHTEHMWLFGIVCVFSSLIMAWILYKGVMQPIENYRQNRISSNTIVT